MPNKANLEKIIRARVTETQKMRLAQIATARQLTPSDIVREAINRYLASKKGAVA